MRCSDKRRERLEAVIEQANTNIFVSSHDLVCSAHQRGNQQLPMTGHSPKCLLFIAHPMHSRSQDNVRSVTRQNVSCLYSIQFTVGLKTIYDRLDAKMSPVYTASNAQSVSRQNVFCLYSTQCTVVARQKVFCLYSTINGQS
ncbi:hypothetical protein PoB_005979000 [Plakobranchus ocellatus]|uniref:Uncharacterized protein n=1 Tax=Plakobranchus ocellatus TaxID=259542 RepID=A0AAV4CMW0_9GAST|nr:hypothetical protein PoB_005979000 [Plakobranchus ocellatus]